MDSPGIGIQIAVLAAVMLIWAVSICVTVYRRKPVPPLPAESYFEKMRVDADAFKARIDFVEYRWEGGLGAVLSSIESGVARADIRSIGGVLFEVFSVEKGHGTLFFPADRICWRPVEKMNAFDLRVIRRKIFG